MDIDIPFKIEFITIKTKNFKEKKRLIKKELKKYPDKKIRKIFIATEIIIKYLVLC